MKQQVVILDSVPDINAIKGILESANGASVAKIYYTNQSAEALAEYGQSSVPCEYRHCLTQLADELIREGYQLIALEETESSEILCRAEIDQKTALILGGNDGISPQLLKRALHLHLPMLGTISNLNAGIAAGIFLYTAYFQQEKRIPLKYL